MNEEPPAGQPEGAWRVVIADDHPLVRDALVRLVGAASDLEVVAEAADGREALELCRRFEPDLVLMDVRMPKMDGIAATREIKQEFPRTIVLMLTAFKDPEYLSEALRAGAAGYILKYATNREVIEAIQAALSGESPINHELAGELLRRLHEPAGKEDLAGLALPSGEPLEERAERPPLELLTTRELEILRLVAKGQTNQDIANNLFISASTVKKHVQHIIKKFKVSDRTQAAILAVELGLLID